MGNLKVYLGADHAGFALKERIKELLAKKDIYFEEFGAYEFLKDDDYVDYAVKVAEKVARHKDSRGILICGTGTGMVVVANKVKGIRAAVGYDKYSVVKGREDNDINILCLRGRNFPDDKNLELVKIWLKSNFSGKERHKRRINKIRKIEK